MTEIDYFCPKNSIEFEKIIKQIHKKPKTSIIECLTDSTKTNQIIKELK